MINSPVKSREGRKILRKSPEQKNRKFLCAAEKGNHKDRVPNMINEAKLKIKILVGVR
jgi:hypothetical protein